MFFDSIKYFFWFILTQNNEIEYESKISRLVVNILGILLSVVFSILFYYLMERFDINEVIKKIIFIYLVIGAFCSMPSENIYLDKNHKSLDGLLIPFGSFKFAPIAPVYLFKYCLNIARKENKIEDN